MRQLLIFPVVLAVGLAFFSCGQTPPTASVETESGLQAMSAEKPTAVFEERQAAQGLADRLGLNAEQRAALDALNARYRETAQRVAAMNRREDASQEVVLQRAQRLRNAYDKDLASLLTAEQRAQYARMRAASQPSQTRAEARPQNTSLEDRLQLTARQRHHLQTLREGLKSRSEYLHSQAKAGRLSREALQENLMALRARFEAALVAMLTPEQKAIWDSRKAQPVSRAE